MSTQALLAVLATQAEIELDNTHKRIAGAYLKVFRTLLQPYNLKRHPLKIVDHHGLVVLTVSGDMFWTLRGGKPLTDLIRQLGEVVDAQPDNGWPRHLVGTIL